MRYTVPMTILASVEVDAPNIESAIREATRFIEARDDDGMFLDGWNDICTQENRPTISHTSGWSVETIYPDEVEENTDNK